MAAKAQEISQEAGSKVAAAMKDVINAAAGIAGFAVESARDLVQYMVRRGQMTQEEADKLLREAEDAHARRGGHVSPPSQPKRPEPELRRPEGMTKSFVPGQAAPAIAAKTAPPAPIAKVAVAKPAPVAKKAAPAKPAKVAKAAKPAAKSSGSVKAKSGVKASAKKAATKRK
jgi:hypothetical protein